MTSGFYSLVPREGIIVLILTIWVAGYDVAGYFTRGVHSWQTESTGYKMNFLALAQWLKIKASHCKSWEPLWAPICFPDAPLPIQFIS